MQSFQSALQTPLTPRRRAVIFVAVFLFTVLVYTIYWFGMAGAMKSQFVAWAEHPQSPDVKVTYDSPEVRGYPFYFNMDLGAFNYQHEGHFRFSSPDLHITARPWAPFRPVLTSNAVSEFELLDEKQTYKIENFRLRVVRPWIKARTHRDTGLYVYANFYGIGLDPSLNAAIGDAVQELSFNAKIMGQVPHITDPASLAAWRDEGGVVELSKVRLQWLPLTLEGEGTMALDPNFQLLASFSTEVSGYHETIDLLRDQGQIKPFPASLFKAALSLLEDPKAPANQPKKIKVPVAIQNSSLSVAGIGLMKWDQVKLP